MRILLILVTCIFSFSMCHGSIRGQANITMGLSADNNDVHEGFSADYSAQNESHLQSWQSKVNLDYSSAINRPSAINGHQFLYSSNAFGGNFNHILKPPTPFMTWNSGADYRETGELNIAGTRSYSWSSFTGPTFKKRIRSDMYLELSIRQGRQKINGNDSDDKYWNARIIKKINSTNDIETSVEENCFDYKSQTIRDGCIDTIEVTYSSYMASTTLSINAGHSISGGGEENIYGLKIDYLINKTDKIALSSNKKQANLQHVLDAFDSDSVHITPETILVSHSLLYERKFKRLSTAIEYEKSKLKRDDARVDESQSSFLSNYLLGSNSCPTCSLQLQYHKTKKVNDGWVSWQIGIKYPLKRHWNALFSVMETRQDLGRSALSFNVQLNYEGKSALIGR